MTRGIMQFSHLNQTILKTVNWMSAREWTLWCPFLLDWTRPFSVEKWKRRVLWGKRWMKKLFIARQSRHCDFDFVIYQELLPTCTLIWPVNIYISRQGKCITGELKYKIRIFCNHSVILTIIPSVVTSVSKRLWKDNLIFFTEKESIFNHRQWFLP